MIRWITETLGTAARERVTEQAGLHLIDVRDAPAGTALHGAHLAPFARVGTS